MPVANADHVTPPRSLETIVGACTAATVTSAIDVSRFKGKYVTVCCDNAAGVECSFYIQFGKPGETSGSAAASVDGSAGAGATKVMFYPGSRDFEIDAASVECRIIPTATGKYRIAASGPGGGVSTP